MKRIVLLLGTVALVAGCTEPTTTTTSPAAPSTVAAHRDRDDDHDDGRVRRDLATLRRVTAPFHRFAKATEAGWSAKITPCMLNGAGAGAMGFHYGNTAYIDGQVRVDQPELLIYEPQKNGRLRLVGVEYIVPLDAWKSASPPRLFGQDFKVNDAFHVWALHAWVWRENPTGIFKDWNPDVSCKATTDIMVM